MAYRPYEVGDRIRSCAAGRIGTVISVPSASARRSPGTTAAKRMAYAQHHYGITIRWDAVDGRAFGPREGRCTVHAGKFELVAIIPVAEGQEYPAQVAS